MAFNLQDYETVEDRLRRFWDEHPEGRVFTDLVYNEGGQYVIKAYIFKNAADPAPWATGYAEEQVSQRGVNQTSALENCETSALGRALANAGYAARGKRPSREEMQKVERATTIKVDPRLADIKAQLGKKFATVDERKSWLEFIVGRDLKGMSDLTAEEIETVSKALALSDKEAANG
jgi:hypothetical protein